MMEKHIDVEVSTSYCTLNELNESTERIWIVFHGQGMLSRYFIKKFETLDPIKNFIVAPQGLSKYYLDGFYGRVGASWMTKEDRLTEISNQRKYISAVLKSENVFNSEKEKVLFGFSQGTATASRFGAFSGITFSKLILWAGMFPEDLLSEEVKHWRGKVDIHYFTGLQDPYLKEGMIEHQKELVENITGMELDFTSFEGKHEVIPALLPSI